jgi:hypothetical protein
MITTHAKTTAPSTTAILRRHRQAGQESGLTRVVTPFWIRFRKVKFGHYPLPLPGVVKHYLIHQQAHLSFAFWLDEEE